MRQLAAILFADMTGYTALMQEDEHLARTKRRRLKEVLESTIGRFNGKILQYYGDGSLSIFNSAIDCIASAIEIQHQLNEEPKVGIRMGIHTGDVIIEDDAVYGDGVNLASRIESMAVAGSIFISDKVYDEIKNQPVFTTRELGYFELKNIKHPVRVYCITNPGINVPTRESLKGKLRQTNNRLAVLPFVNMSSDADNEYFSDGITEELLNALTRVDGLQVTSRTSAFAFKNRNHDIRDIAIQLNVDKVLEGSVRKSGNRVRITAQLINASDGYHIWSENYDRDLTDIFAVQDEISAIIANKLREDITPKPKKDHRAKTHTTNITAYTYFLKGLHFWNKLTPADSRKAIECFEQAISIDPNYAQAYAMTAAAYSYLGSSGQIMPVNAFEIVHRYSDKALEIDSNIAESHIAKASAYLFFDWDWDRAYNSQQKAHDLNPGAIDAYDMLGFYYIVMDQKQKAVEALETAEMLDPLSPVICQSLGNMYIFSERYDDAKKQADKLLELDPRMRIAIEMKGWAFGMQGDWETALRYFEEMQRLTNHPLKGWMGAGFAYAKLGMKDKALEVILKMEQREREEPGIVMDADIAAVWLGLGNHDKTFEYLNRCIDKRMGPVSYFVEYPPYRAIKSDPRYIDLKKRMNMK